MKTELDRVIKQVGCLDIASRRDRSACGGWGRTPLVIWSLRQLPHLRSGHGVAALQPVPFQGGKGESRASLGKAGGLTRKAAPWGLLAKGPWVLLRACQRRAVLEPIRAGC